MSGASERTFPRFDGGARAIAWGSGAAVIGLGLTVVRAFVGEGGAKIALFSYFTAFAYWLGLSLAALLMLMIFYASHAKWMVVVRRPIESMAASVIIFPVLFIPVIVWVKQLYPWANPPENFPETMQQLFAHRRVYLNEPFFFARAAFYFIVWIALAWTLWRWSTKQDASGDPELTARSWRLGAGGLPIAGITLTFAAFDWLMSLSTFWQSSVWGVYYFAGSFVAAFALLIVMVRFLERSPALSGALTVAHWLSLGKFLLAFTCFWAYIAYSQYMLTWIANEPDTIPYLLLRQGHGWQRVGWLLILGHFVVPFLILLSRKVKMRPTQLATVALWILFIHYIDLYAVVMPQVRPEQPLLDWANVTSFVGVGGLVIALATRLLRGRFAIPVKDPYLADSLAYSKMM
jgi:hypothetical protein